VINNKNKDFDGSFLISCGLVFLSLDQSPQWTEPRCPSGDSDSGEERDGKCFYALAIVATHHSRQTGGARSFDRVHSKKRWGVHLANKKMAKFKIRHHFFQSLLEGTMATIPSGQPLPSHRPGVVSSNHHDMQCDGDAFSCCSSSGSINSSATTVIASNVRVVRRSPVSCFT
jgi:hypothetical protein